MTGPLTFVGCAPSRTGDGRRIAAKHGRFTKGIAEQDMGRRAGSARLLCTVLSKLDKLELSCRGDRIHVRAGVDHCTLARKNALAGRRSDDRPRDSVGAIDRHGRVHRVDRGRHIDRGVEWAVRGLVVRALGSEADVGEAETRKASDDIRA